MNSEVVFENLVNRIEQNNKGGIACYFRRIPVLFPIILQKMHINKEVTIPLFFGDTMRVITGEVISSTLLSFSYSEVALTALMLKLILPGQVIIDIGTHFGYEALLASRLVGQNGTVSCFEPNPATYRLASCNLKKPNVTIHNNAVGSYNGTVVIQNRPIAESAFNAISNDNETDSITVPLVTLDSMFNLREKPINFIKCDVEGFELEVLKGCVAILKEDKPILVLEADIPSADANNNRANEIARFLLNFDYNGYSFDLKGSNLIIDDLAALNVSHANILFVHKSQSSIIHKYINSK